MGEKVYKPILKDGDHLIHSKENPDRVRGLTRDENNQNPDIPEWEEYDIDDLRDEGYESNSYEEQQIQLTPEQEELADKIAEDLANVIVAGGILVLSEFIVPWWQNIAWPWVKEKGYSIKKSFKDKKEQKPAIASNIKRQTASGISYAEVSSQIDKVFEAFYFEMDEDEAKAHMMRLIYHMLGMVNEIRIISNARIKKNCESEELYIEHRKEAEKFLSGKVATTLNQLLSNENLQLDLNTSKELYALTGGGIRRDGEYIPIQATKIDEVLKSFPLSEQHIK